MTDKSILKTSQFPDTFYRVSVKAIIRNKKGEVLVNKEGDFMTWSLPGGGWEHGETEHQALARELKEEVGLVEEFSSKLVTTAIFWMKSKSSWLLWIVYEVSTSQTSFNISESSSEVRFIDPKSLEDYKGPAEKWVFENC